MYIIFLLVISVYKFDENNQYNTSSCVYVEVPLIPQSLRYELYLTLMTSRIDCKMKINTVPALMFTQILNVNLHQPLSCSN